MKSLLKEKGPRFYVLILMAIACLGNPGGCVSEDVYSPDIINGYYEYEETVYQNPLSSYLVTKENASDYIITNNSVTIVHSDGTEEKIDAGFEKSEVDQAAFTALFIMPEAGMPDISVYQKRLQYRVDEQYSLYVMDHEIWWARCSPVGTMWSIFRLVKVDLSK